MFPKLTPNFSKREFVRSDTAERLGISNEPETWDHLANIRTLALGMEQVRSICGNVPVTITSGYRSPRVNAAVGGVETSHHALGLAADFTVKGYEARDVALMLAASHLVFDQLILEPSRGIVHISFYPSLRGEILTQPDGPGTPVFEGVL